VVIDSRKLGLRDHEQPTGIIRSRRFSKRKACSSKSATTMAPAAMTNSNP
jgi:hypothetical protein